MRRTCLLLTLLLAACSSPPGEAPPTIETPDVADAGAADAESADTGPAPVDCADSRDGTTCKVTDAGRWVCYEGRCVDPNAEPDTGTAAQDAGDTCVCDAVTQCCDGCQPKREGQRCRQPQKNFRCEQGYCVESCECTDATKRCCDGCNFEPKTHKCGLSWVEYCEGGDSNGCAADVYRERWEIYCSGKRADCRGGQRIKIDPKRVRTCDPSEKCFGPSSDSIDANCFEKSFCDY